MSEFPITLGLCQWSSLIPSLFALVMNELIRHIQDVQWYMFFVDDIVLVDETSKCINARLKIWRKALCQKILR